MNRLSNRRKPSSHLHIKRAVKRECKNYTGISVLCSVAGLYGRLGQEKHRSNNGIRRAKRLQSRKILHRRNLYVNTSSRESIRKRTICTPNIYRVAKGLSHGSTNLVLDMYEKQWCQWFFNNGNKTTILCL